MVANLFTRLLASLTLLGLCATVEAEQRVTQPYVGITYIDRTETAPRDVHMHIVQIDLTAASLRFTLSPPRSWRSTCISFCRFLPLTQRAGSPAHDRERALVNRSSDNAAGRAVGTSLGVFARPR